MAVSLVFFSQLAQSISWQVRDKKIDDVIARIIYAIAHLNRWVVPKQAQVSTMNKF